MALSRCWSSKGVPTPPVVITVARCRHDLESGTDKAIPRSALLAPLLAASQKLAVTRHFISGAGGSYFDYLEPRDLPLQRGTTNPPGEVVTCLNCASMGFVCLPALW